MAAPSASRSGFVPDGAPQVSVAADATLAAIHEAARVTILELPNGAPIAQIGVDPDATASETAWVGAPGRLIVLARYEAHCAVHLLDPYGPRTIAEIRLEQPMRLVASVGSTALVVGSFGAAVLAATETHLTLYPLPTRSIPLAAGAAAAQILLALPGSIEEWDPRSRTPKRRLRLPRVAAITAVGGSERLVWMTTHEEPARIDVIPLINRGQPRAHDLPEPIARVAAHPRSDLLACIGAESGKLYVIDLDGRIPTYVTAPEGIDRIESAALVVGRSASVLVAQARRPIATVSLARRDPTRAEASAEHPVATADARRGASRDARGPLILGGGVADAPSREVDDDADGDVDDDADDDPIPSSVAQPGAPAQLQSSAEASVPSAPPLRGAPPLVASGAIAKASVSAGERFSAWRELVRQQQPDLAPSAPPDPSRIVHVEPASMAPDAALNVRADAASDVRAEAASGVRADTASGVRPEVASGVQREVASWRDEVVAWSRATRAGPLAAAAPAAPAIEALAVRFELAPELQPALVLLYGAHLRGANGVAPVELAHLLGGRWDEALGRGELAQRAIAIYTASRIALAPAALRMLDELPPTTGALVGTPGAVALLGPCVVVAGDDPLAAVAARCLDRVGGAVLAAHPGADAAALAFEARVYGAAAMRRATADDGTSSEPTVLVVADAELADLLGVPRLT